MGRPAKEGTRRYVRLREPQWERIDSLAGTHNLDFSEVIQIALGLGLVDERLPALLNRDTLKSAWEAVQELAHLDTLRAMISDDKIDWSLFDTPGEATNAVASTKAAKKWLALSASIDENLDAWLFSQILPKVETSSEFSDARASGTFRIEKQSKRWFLLVKGTPSKRLLVELNKLEQNAQIVRESEGRWLINDHRGD